MQHLIDSLTLRPFVTLGAGVVLGGVVLAYLAIQRDRRHRILEAQRQQQRG